VVEGLDLPADIGFALGQLRDRGDRDALGGQEITGAVGGVDLDADIEEVARERGDAVSVGH